MTLAPYYADENVHLYHGDALELLADWRRPGPGFDCIVTDPPYGETSLEWDRWPDGWPDIAAAVTSSMWCFGSMRMFLDRRDDFTSWKMSHDVVWRKPVASSAVSDRFRRNHELALHWYQGPWADVYHEGQRIAHHGENKGHIVRSAKAADWHGQRGQNQWSDDGTRLMMSVLDVTHMRLRGTHPTEKPIGILDPLIRYACPPGGVVLDPFAGSGSTLDAARASGRLAVGIEAREDYCEVIARRLQQGTLDYGSAS